MSMTLLKTTISGLISNAKNKLQRTQRSKAATKTIITTKNTNNETKLTVFVKI